MSFKLTILGSNSALPTSERYSTAQVLQMPGRSFLLDCGEGTQIQLRRYKISFDSIKAIFITHLHGDHYFGILGLLSSFNMLGRKSALRIYGPPKIKDFISENLKFLEVPMGFEIIYCPIITDFPLLIFDDEKISVTAFPLKHRIVTYGYLFREKDKQRKIRKDAIEKYSISIRDIKRIKEGEDLQLDEGTVIKNEEITINPEKPVSYAFCTDTLFDENIATVVKDVTLLYHEATFSNKYADRARETYHSTSQQAAIIAKKANVEKLIIGHFSARISNFESLLQEAKSEFENTFLVEDGDSFTF